MRKTGYMPKREFIEIDINVYDVLEFIETYATESDLNEIRSLLGFDTIEDESKWKVFSEAYPHFTSTELKERLKR